MQVTHFIEKQTQREILRWGAFVVIGNTIAQKLS